MTIRKQSTIISLLGLLNRRNRCKREGMSDKNFLLVESRTYNCSLKFGNMEVGEEIKHTARFYDTEGRLCVISRFFSGGNSINIMLYDYGKSPLIRRILVCSCSEDKEVVIAKLKEQKMLEMSLEKEIIYEYNSDNTVKSITGKLRLLNQIYDNGYVACYEYYDKGYISRIYDEKGEFLLSLVFDRSGILRQKRRSDSDLVKRSYNKYIYNRNQQVQKVVRVYKRHRSVKATYEYNEYGDCIYHYQKDSDNEEHLIYKYDERGNWIEKRDDYSREDLQKRGTFNITERNIIYRNASDSGASVPSELINCYVDRLIESVME